MFTNPTPMPPRPPLPTDPPAEPWLAVPAGQPPQAELADLLATGDRTRARIVTLLTRQDDPDAFGGLDPRLWLRQVCRQTRAETRVLLATARTLQQLPAVAVGLADGRLSWSQTVQLCKAARQLPVGRQRLLDELIGDALDEYAAYEPDELVDRVWDQVDEWEPSRLEDAEAAADRDEWLSLQPNLFGGGRMIAELNTEHFATACEALHAPLHPPTVADLDNVQVDEAVALSNDEIQAAAMAQVQSRAMVDRLVTLLEQGLAGIAGDGATIPPRPTAYVVTTADALLDADRTPGWLLTTLAGGKMKASTGLIRRLLDQRGADLRGIILDDCGEVVGVGHTTHVPPGWLREAIWARDLQDAGPGSTTPVRRCDLDHRIQWPTGPTDVVNLQPLGRRIHTAKTATHWTVARARDGTPTWTHRTSGIVIRRPPTRRRLDGTTR